ncbi:hypothetical protein DB788_06940 [Staphylococcus aureus]|nr:hypothetical protein C7R22_02490 [Staphylococcus aureus]PZJ98754.1 hypothetical protein C7P69_04555 [Staphylococcus aureus]RQX37947.1 hypothetical protein DB788_06940 [Staphylococcus aureus]
MSQALQCYIGGLPTQKLAKIQLTIMCELAGPQHREIGTPISTGNASWGETEINFAKISFLSYSLYHFCSNPVMLKF